MNVEDFDYTLPEASIAQYPLPERDSSRLMVLDRSNKKIFHTTFTSLVRFFSKEDLLVLNNSKVYPAKIKMTKTDSSIDFEGLVLKITGDDLVTMAIKKSKRLSIGSMVAFNGGELSACVVKKNEDGTCLLKIQKADGFMKWLTQNGSIPLPHYIKREGQKDSVLDQKRYQTIYAKQTGSIAAPTAGLHFTDRMIKRLQNKGLNIAEITLHVGYATFKPIREKNILNHKMGEEEYVVPLNVLHQIYKTKENKGKILAVGTTATRTIESLANSFAYPPSPAGKNDIKSNTSLFIYPGYSFKIVDCILTNFHLPKSTLFMLVCAFGGHDFVLRAYKEAIKHGYRFYSYGDAMLII